MKKYVDYKKIFESQENAITLKQSSEDIVVCGTEITYLYDDIYSDDFYKLKNSGIELFTPEKKLPKFYCIPKVDLFAKCENGYLGTLNGSIDSPVPLKVIYIDEYLNVFNLECNSLEFIDMILNQNFKFKKNMNNEIIIIDFE